MAEFRPSLLAHDTVLLQRLATVISGDARIHSADGSSVVGIIRTLDNVHRRAVLGNRTYAICEPDGRVLCHLQDTVDLGADRFRILAPDGTLLAQLRRRFDLLRLRVDIDTGSSMPYRMEAPALDVGVRLFRGEHPVARLTETWPHPGRFLLAHRRYRAQMTPRMPTEDRLLTLGCFFAAELMRTKWWRRLFPVDTLISLVSR
ncbi:MAG: hypothetical protein Q4G40_10765 [Brachybacterium sp.]|nr:hypothetical protein [Brachybacterium sp.]